MSYHEHSGAIHVIIVMFFFQLPHSLSFHPRYPCRVASLKACPSIWRRHDDVTLELLCVERVTLHVKGPVNGVPIT